MTCRLVPLRLQSSSIFFLGHGSTSIYGVCCGDTAFFGSLYKLTVNGDEIMPKFRDVNRPPSPSHHIGTSQSSFSSAAAGSPCQNRGSDDKWNELYTRLLSYKLRHGDCKVPTLYPQDKALGNWVKVVRQNYKNMPVDNARRQQLDSIGFVWNTKEAFGSWDEMYTRLLVYKVRHGDCNVPAAYPQDKALGGWVKTQRCRLKNVPLDNERRQKLDSIGFTWQIVTSWNAMFNRLVIYQQRYGDCDVPRLHPQDKALGEWVRVQRDRLKNMPSDNVRRQQLESLGFTWHVEETTSWDEMYTRLLVYKVLNGDCDVPRSYPRDKSLGEWVSTQRERLKNVPLDNEQWQQLESLGFTWQLEETTNWDEMFQRLVTYKQWHGDCNVPQSYPQDKSLGGWVKEQRKLLQNAPLENEQRQQLESLGFTWLEEKTKWDDMFQRLLAYKQQHGDCNTPKHYSPDTALGIWVSNQRVCFKHVPMDNEQRQQLERIGFIWNLEETTRWDKMFNRLVAYKQRHGNCNTPIRYPRDKALGVWVRTQRNVLKNARLDDERRRRLNSIGFSWQRKSMASWDEMFNRLVAYKQQHGDCNTPKRYPRDKALGEWVKKQRRHLKKAPLDNVRRQRLDEIGFTWQLKEMTSWDERVAAHRLVAIQQGHGDCYSPQAYPQDKSLGQTQTQRCHLWQVPLNSEQRHILESMGLSPQLYERGCDKVYQQSLAFRSVQETTSRNELLSRLVAYQQWPRDYYTLQSYLHAKALGEIFQMQRR